MTDPLAGDFQSFDFSTFPMDAPTQEFSFDPALLEIPTFNPGHTRHSSNTSVFSNISHASTVATDVGDLPLPLIPTHKHRAATPRNASPAPAPSRRSSTPIRQHGPILLPKIRSQDQAIQSASSSSISIPRTKSQRTMRTPSATPPPPPVKRRRQQTQPPISQQTSIAFRPMHARSYTNPEPVANFNMSFTPPPEEQIASSSLLSSPVQFAVDATPTPAPALDHERRASSCSLELDGNMVQKYGFPTYRQMPSFTTTSSTTPAMTSTANAVSSTASPSMTATSMAPVQSLIHPHAETFMFPSCAFPKAQSPFSLPDSLAGTPEPMAMPAQARQHVEPTTTLLSHLTSSNPSPSLVRTLSFPLRDPNTKHFWWDIRQIRPWTDFTAQSILSLPGALSTLTAPVPQSMLPMPSAGVRHPETEAELHSIYTNHYIPRLNSALASSSSSAPVQFSLPSKGLPGLENLIVAHVAGDSASAAAIFGGKPSARIVGLVRSFDRFNTGMRVEGNVKRVEYLRGLAALHYAMREHGCRYGFIITEIEVVVVRNCAEAGTPFFGFLEVSSVQLAHSGDGSSEDGQQEMTACLALWGLAHMAGMDANEAKATGVAPWKAEIGAPAEGTRRKALERDGWMPGPQLAEKREAKRARGWVWPEDAVGRKELGKRGVRYSAC